MIAPSTNTKATEILANARTRAQKMEEFSQGGFHFVMKQGHILESLCRHEGVDVHNCSKCLFQQELSIPELPEMVFPHNILTISFPSFPDSNISFNALDALRMVSSDTLPDVQVAASVIWQEARKEFFDTHKQAHPFDWTFSTEYSGTSHNCIIEPSTETIDMERLKQQDEIKFYSQTKLFEDELADHGCSEITVRIRVMPDFFFVLMRFYLRVDGVKIRVCDTRITGDNNSDHMLREWSLREATYDQLSSLPSSLLLNSNQIWMHLPVLKTVTTTIRPNKE